MSNLLFFLILTPPISAAIKKDSILVEYLQLKESRINAATTVLASGLVWSDFVPSPAIKKLNNAARIVPLINRGRRPILSVTKQATKAPIKPTTWARNP